jgi:hypothetical protein
MAALATRNRDPTRGDPEALPAGVPEKEEIMSLFDDVKNNLVEWYTISSDKTAEMARVTSRRYDKFGISRDIERQFGELGSLVYNGLKEDREDILADPAVHALMQRIQGLEDELSAKNEEIEKIKNEFNQRRTRPAEAAAATTVMTQPALDEGAEESAILVEPVVVDVEEAVADGAGEQVVEEIIEGTNPEKEG